MLAPEPRMVGRFEEHAVPSGSVVYKEIRGDEHYYYAEVHSSASSPGGYAYVEGSVLTGVSTAAKFLDGDPDPLMGWAARCDQAGIARIVSADMQNDRSLDWLCSPDRIAARLYAEEATWNHERKRRGEEGTNVHHQTVWKLATGQGANLAHVSDAERGFSQGVFASFRHLGLAGKVTHAEQLTVAFRGEASPVRGIAGTFDLLAEEVDVDRLLDRVVNLRAVPSEIQKRSTLRLLADYKTRAKPGKIRKSDHVQVQGYEDCNRQCGIGDTDAQVVIIVLPDGTYEVYWCEATFSQWAAAVQACEESKPLDSRIRAMQQAAKTAREMRAEIETATAKVLA
jgi:hypothetical protein